MTAAMTAGMTTAGKTAPPAFAPPRPAAPAAPCKSCSPTPPPGPPWASQTSTCFAASPPPTARFLPGSTGNFTNTAPSPGPPCARPCAATRWKRPPCTKCKPCSRSKASPATVTTCKACCAARAWKTSSAAWTPPWPLATCRPTASSWPNWGSCAADGRPPAASIRRFAALAPAALSAPRSGQARPQAFAGIAKPLRATRAVCVLPPSRRRFCPLQPDFGQIQEHQKKEQIQGHQKRIQRPFHQDLMLLIQEQINPASDACGLLAGSARSGIRRLCAFT